MSRQRCPYCRHEQDADRTGACVACGRELPPLAVAAGPPPHAAQETAIRPASLFGSADPAREEALANSAAARKELERLERSSFAAIEGLGVGLAQPLPEGTDATVEELGAPLASVVLGRRPGAPEALVPWLFLAFCLSILFGALAGSPTVLGTALLMAVMAVAAAVGIERRGRRLVPAVVWVCPRGLLWQLPGR